MIYVISTEVVFSVGHHSISEWIIFGSPLINIYDGSIKIVGVGIERIFFINKVLDDNSNWVIFSYYSKVVAFVSIVWISNIKYYEKSIKFYR